MYAMYIRIIYALWSHSVFIQLVYKLLKYHLWLLEHPYTHQLARPAFDTPYFSDLLDLRRFCSPNHALSTTPMTAKTPPTVAHILVK